MSDLSRRSFLGALGAAPLAFSIRPARRPEDTKMADPIPVSEDPDCEVIAILVKSDGSELRSAQRYRFMSLVREQLDVQITMRENALLTGGRIEVYGLEGVHRGKLLLTVPVFLPNNRAIQVFPQDSVTVYIDPIIFE